MARTKYHKFRDGERCDECGARQWFAQDALRYCRNGHRLEGFANHETDEDDFGTQGRVSRKKKETRRKVAVKLTGDEGRELYLEIVQLILIRQVRWLVDTQGFPDDFTELVRALWALRVRNLPLRERGGERGDGADKGDESDAGTSSAWFSSQSETGESSGGDFSDATTATWAPDARRRWKLPKLIDTLALCYLACLVRRLPVSTGDFHNWAQKGDLEFLSAVCSFLLRQEKAVSLTCDSSSKCLVMCVIVYPRDTIEHYRCRITSQRGGFNIRFSNLSSHLR